MSIVEDFVRADLQKAMARHPLDQFYMNPFDRIQAIVEMWQREFAAKLVFKFIDKKGWMNAKVVLPGGEMIQVAAKDFP